MTDASRRGVTRGYVGGLIAAATVLALALVIASWGGIGYFTGLAPVSTPGVWVLAGEVIVGVALAALVWGLWSQALVLLRGRSGPPWAHTLVLAVGGYLIWCLGGLLAGLGIEETWLSPFAVALGLCWGVCSLAFWAVLARRVYTARPVPRWPWERRGESGPNGAGPQEPGEPDGPGDRGGRGGSDGAA
ncbi:MAG: hypothetical protein ACNYNX_06580 [Leucobacter sp.]